MPAPVSLHRYLDACRRCAPSPRRLRAAAVARVGDRLHAVEHEIDHHLLDLGRVGLHRRQPAAAFQAHRDAVQPRLRLEHAHRLAGQRVDVDRRSPRSASRRTSPRMPRRISPARRPSMAICSNACRSAVRVADAGAHAMHGALRVVGDRAQRLIDLVRQRRRHLADGVQAQHVRELLLMAPQLLLQALELRDVGRHRCRGRRAHPSAPRSGNFTHT